LLLCDFSGQSRYFNDGATVFFNIVIKIMSAINDGVEHLQAEMVPGTKLP
jgi:hypothetical protein